MHPSSHRNLHSSTARGSAAWDGKGRRGLPLSFHRKKKSGEWSFYAGRGLLKGDLHAARLQMAGPSLRYSEAALAYALSLANDTESSPTKSVGKASSPQVPGNATSATVSHGTYFAEPPSPDAPLRQHRYQTGPDSTDAKMEAPLQACAESVACENSSDDRRRGMHDLVEFHDEDTGEVAYLSLIHI